jgi:hypothetical protein
MDISNIIPKSNNKQIYNEVTILTFIMKAKTIFQKNYSTNIEISHILYTSSQNDFCVW